MPSSAPLVESPLNDFKDTLRLMKIARIWFSGIRMLNTPADHGSSDLTWRDHLTALHRLAPLEPGVVNILLGENGSGKSTIIDMLRSLRYPEILASLPRENPPKQSLPAYSVEFDSGQQVSYLFSPTPLDKNLDSISHVGCYQLTRTDNRLELKGQGDLYKHALACPIPEFFSYPDVCYHANTQPEDCFDDALVFELNEIRHNLRSVAVTRRGPAATELLNQSSFQIGETGHLHVWFDDDHLMSNHLQGHWLPSGWRAFASIAAWLRSCPEHTVCLIEEPETHLHPTLMRCLMETLINIASTRDQQLFISTHSAALINIAAKDQLKIFQSYSTHIDCKPDLGTILDRMGYMASDILQANCVIWVEGPSDRLYLNHWIKGMAPELREGTHYSIMFYGGRLLSHLTADDDDNNESDLISLATLNRHSAILLDSDKDSPHKRINATKKRIVAEFSQNEERLAWVTKGREVENYLNMDKLEAIIKTIHPSAAKIAEKSTWANLLEYRKPRAKKNNTANKVKVASSYVNNHAPDYSTLDLKPRMEELCRFIKRWNAGMLNHSNAEKNAPRESP